MSVNGGWMDTSTSAVSAGFTRSPRSRTVWSATMWSWCIFQLALTSGRRPDAWPDRAAGARCPSRRHRSLRNGRLPARWTRPEAPPGPGGPRSRAATRRPLRRSRRSRSVGQALVVDRADAVAATDHGAPGAIGDRPGDPVGSLGEPLVLERTDRAVPEHGARCRDGLGEGFAVVSGPMSSPCHPSGMSAPSTLVSAWLPIPGGTDPVPSRPAPVPPRRSAAGSRCRRECSSLRQSSIRSVVDHRRPDLVTERGQEGERHGATDRDHVGLLGQCTQDAELVGHLGSTEHHDERPPRVVEEPAENLDLRPTAGRPRSAAGSGARRPRRGRGVRPRRPRSRMRRSPRPTGPRTRRSWPSHPGRTAGCP
jgi:hypothetical protein